MIQNFLGVFLEMGKNFLKDRMAELNAVTWPTRKQAVHASITVLTIMFIVGLILTFVDFGLSQAIQEYILNI